MEHIKENTKPSRTHLHSVDWSGRLGPFPWCRHLGGGCVPGSGCPHTNVHHITLHARVKLHHPATWDFRILPTTATPALLSSAEAGDQLWPVNRSNGQSPCWPAVRHHQYSASGCSSFLTCAVGMVVLLGQTTIKSIK